MKRTELERKQRDLAKVAKKEEVLARKGSASKYTTVGEYITALHKAFFYDEEQIYNIDNDENVLEIIAKLKSETPKKQWESVLRKAIRKTKVKKKDEAYAKLYELLSLL